MASNTTKTTTTIETKPDANTTTTSSETSINNIEKAIQDHTPAFASKTIISTTNALESFRVNYFNSQYIFYPILAVVVFLVLRYFWRKIF